MSIWASSRAIFWGIVLLALTSVLAACGPSENAASPGGGSATETSPSEVLIFEGLLGTIPDTPDTRKSVTINDYAAVREILGIPPTAPDARWPGLLEYAIQSVGQSFDGIKIHLGTGPFISGMDDKAMVNTKRKYLAFDVRNIDQSVEAGMHPSILEVVRGRFDPDATAQTLASCSECPPPDIENYNDVPFYSWGEDFAGNLRRRNTPPAFDHLGRGGRIAVSSEYVYRTVETPGMKALIDARAGDGKLLADVEEFRLLAQAMSGLGAYGAFFSNQTHKVSTVVDNTSNIATVPDLQEKLIEEIGKSTLLLPYLAFSTGVGRDGAGSYMALALVHSDAESADENGRRLERRIAENPELQPWIEGLEEYTYRVKGRVLSAMLRGDGPASIWKSLIFRITPLIPHE